MEFVRDEQYARQIQNVFGEYVGTGSTPLGDVRADLFARGDYLVAYVSFPTGSEPGHVRSPYYSAITNFAHDRGYGDRFRVIYSGSGDGM